MLGAPRFVILIDRQLRDIRHQKKNYQTDSLPGVANSYSYSRILKTLDFELAWRLLLCVHTIKSIREPPEQHIDKTRCKIIGSLQH